MIEKKTKINIGQLNAALSMLLAMPEFSNGLRTPGNGRVDVNAIAPGNLKFLEGVCRNGCGVEIPRPDGGKTIAFKDCLITIRSNGRATLMRDPGRVRLSSTMTVDEIEAVADAA